MERDLYDCIAKFGSPGFYTRHMKISQLGKAVATAVKCVPQLKTVCAEAGLRPDGKPDINEDHLGIYVKTAPPKEQPGGPHAQLALLRRKRSQRLAWIGYERSENDGLVPVVYLYCSERYAPRVAQNLKSQFKSNLKRWGNDFAVYKDPAITQEDRKWFVGVVRRLVELAQRQRSHTKS